MNPIAEILSQGEEVVSGQTVDSNAAWLSQNLTDLGFDVTRHSACGDRLTDLVDSIQTIAQRADCCICSGGLGPTLDDLTREAASIASGVELVFDAEALQTIEAYFDQRQRPMPDINRNQAYLPQGALRIDNPVGTAPGFMQQIGRCWFAFLPGVPREMKAMYPAVEQQLKSRFQFTPKTLITLRSFGIGESAIQQRLADLQLPDGVNLGFRAMIDEVQTKLLFEAGCSLELQTQIAEQVQQAIGDQVFAIDGLTGQAHGDLFQVVDQAMRQRSLSLTSLETASGGLFAARSQNADWHHTALIAKQPQQVLPEYGVQKVADLPIALQQRHGGDLVLVQWQEQNAIQNFLLTPDGLLQHNVNTTQLSNPSYHAQLSLDQLRRYLLPKHQNNSSD